MDTLFSARGFAVLVALVVALFAPGQERDPNLPADYEASLAAMSAAFAGGALELEDGTKLAWHIRDGDGPNLVLIPGSWGDYLSFNRFVPHLDANLRIIIIELRGHGDSGNHQMGATMADLADDVMRVVAHLGLDRYYLGGHSIGGMLAVEIAGRAPEGLAGAIPMEGWTHHTVQFNAFGHLGPFPSTPAVAAERAANRDRGQARLTPEEIRDFASIWRKWDGYEALLATSTPMLQLWGDRGQKERPGRAMMQIPDRENIQIFWIPNASHAHLVEQPEAGAQAVNAFIRSVEAQAAAGAPAESP
ncbi:MAG: alpha/beta hydrolase [Candidatus Hydrogenedentes bacterium]|nr:alpha/beta hydrolase [Candidatus Hydrogenedentota bacterium]